MTTTTTTHRITADMLADKGYCITANVRIDLAWTYDHGNRCTLGFNPEGREGRQAHQGPIVTDLFGWLNREPAVIAAHPIADPRPVITVAEGDRIEVEGHGTFVVGRTATRYNRDMPTVTTLVS